MRKTFITTSLIAILMAIPAIATQQEIDQKTVTSKYYVDQGLGTKQDTITTDRVVLVEGSGGNSDVTVPALVSYGTSDGGNGTDGLLGDKIGMLDYETVDSMTAEAGILEFADTGNLSNVDTDSVVPTVRAVANGLASFGERVEDYVSTSIQNIDESKQDRFTCAGYVSGHENQDDWCWLYNIGEASSLSGGVGGGSGSISTISCQHQNESCSDNVDCCSNLVCSSGGTCQIPYQEVGKI